MIEATTVRVPRTRTHFAGIFLLLVFALVFPVHADRFLDGEKARVQEIRHSMLGFRDTLLFFTFTDQRAVLVLSIGNEDETFPVSARLHLFDESVSSEGLEKFVNNQHSDGLFLDVPEPESTVELPCGICEVTSREQTGTSPSPTGEGTFRNYEVEWSVAEHSVEGSFRLTAFSGTARVHVPEK